MTMKKSQKTIVIALLAFLLLFLGAAVFMYIRHRTDYDPIKVDSILKSQKGYKK